jgi:hypothetical protein
MLCAWTGGASDGMVMRRVFAVASPFASSLSRAVISGSSLPLPLRQTALHPYSTHI